MAIVIERIPVNTTRQVERTVCDRCGAPARLDFGSEYLHARKISIPVRIRDRGSYSSYVWRDYRIDACDDCITAMWRWFDCKGTPVEKE